MTKSTNIVDKRLMDLYVVNQAQQRGLRFGLRSTIINKKTNRRFTIPSKVHVKYKEDLLWESQTGRSLVHIAKDYKSLSNFDAGPASERKFGVERQAEYQPED